MAGHSKWANIKFRKAAQDAKRGKLFTKLIREITVSARAGGGDADANPRLRTAIDKALAANMTRDTIDRAVSRGAGDNDESNYEEVRYEGYGPGGIAFLVECTTDNRNRTVSEVRHAFSKHGGNLGTDGSVAYLFTRIGLFVFAPGSDEDKIMEEAIAVGAEDVQVNDDGSVEVVTTPEEYEAVKSAFKDAGLVADLAEIVQRPATETELVGEDADTIEKLIEMLEDLDDVQEVYTNAVLADR
jgi:YebC/PmpR family DNA-binding regulatory protein